MSGHGHYTGLTERLKEQAVSEQMYRTGGRTTKQEAPEAGPQQRTEGHQDAFGFLWMAVMAAATQLATVPRRCQ